MEPEIQQILPARDLDMVNMSRLGTGESLEEEPLAQYDLDHRGGVEPW